MTHPVYNRHYLEGKGIKFLKQIASDLGIVPSGNKTKIATWVDAIVEHQSNQVEKVEPQPEILTEKIAQVEPLIECEAEVATVEIEEAHEPEKPEAEIVNDGDACNPWVLMSGESEVIRGGTYLKVANSGISKKFNIINTENQCDFDSLANWSERGGGRVESKVVVKPFNFQRVKITLICSLGKNKLYAVNRDGLLVGYVTHADLFGLTMSVNSPQLVSSLFANCQSDTGAVSTLTHKTLLATT